MFCKVATSRRAASSRRHSRRSVGGLTKDATSECTGILVIHHFQRKQNFFFHVSRSVCLVNSVSRLIIYLWYYKSH